MRFMSNSIQHKTTKQCAKNILNLCTFLATTFLCVHCGSFVVRERQLPHDTGSFSFRFTPLAHPYILGK